MTTPIPLMVKRFQCPHCVYRRAKKATVADHIERCWRNPDARGCLTCQHWRAGDSGEPEVGYPGSPESCAQGVDLSGRPACGSCSGVGGHVVWPAGGVSECQTCGGDAGEVKPGPIVHCAEWEVIA